MELEKKIFCSYHISDRPFFSKIRKSFLGEPIIIFDRNVNSQFGGSSVSLFKPSKLDRELGYPDLAIVIISENFVTSQSEWTKEELHALFALEQFKETKFIIPVLTGKVEDSQIPNYLKTNPERIIDFRNKEFEDAISSLKSAIKSTIKKKIFIGHGRSPIWKDLRDHIKDNLHLEFDSFEAVPTAGYSIKERLLDMLSKAQFAFLIMTAEDIHSDGVNHARENVIHEIGLFQGRIGFERAIILLENGCKEFSNKSGVVHINFEKDNLEGSFHKIEEVLKREKIIS